MTCLCCGSSSTHTVRGKVLAISLCNACDGAHFIVTGKASGGWGWKGRDATERTFALECPKHGRRDPVDVELDDLDDGWLCGTSKAGRRYSKAYPVRTRAGHNLYLLDYEVTR